MIQIDGPRRPCFHQIHKWRTYAPSTAGHCWDTGIQTRYRWVVSSKHFKAGMGIRKVRIANLPPEVPDRTIRDTLAKYGEMKDTKEELRTKAYRYKVSNGIRIVEMNLKLHLPSHMIMAGHRVLVSYEGQPSTCYACNESGHQYQNCPNRKRIVHPKTYHVPLRGLM